MADTEKEQSISIPSFNPADAQSEVGVYEFLIDQILQRIEKVAPAQILSYDRRKNRATVQILNQGITSTGAKVPKKSVPDIPALVLQGGGFNLSFPIKAGDIGWIVAADRDISVFKKLLQMFAPATYRKHQYKDGFFIPNKINDFNISEDDEASVLLTSEDGTTQISLKDGQTTITADSIVLNGDVTVNGTVTASGDVTGAGISLKTHVHGGVQAGGGTTGVPQ